MRQFGMKPRSFEDQGVIGKTTLLLQLVIGILFLIPIAAAPVVGVYYILEGGLFVGIQLLLGALILWLLIGMVNVL